MGIWRVGLKRRLGGCVHTKVVVALSLAKILQLVQRCAVSHGPRVKIKAVTPKAGARSRRALQCEAAQKLEQMGVRQTLVALDSFQYICASLQSSCVEACAHLGTAVNETLEVT